MGKEEVMLKQRLASLQQETQDLAQGLLIQLRQMPAVSGGEELVKRWEQIEAIAGALEMAQRLLAEEDGEAIKQGVRQLRRWRRQEGKNGNAGWIEIRRVKGFGPYVSYRSRQKKEETLGGEGAAGEEEMATEKGRAKTEYYGRLDRFAERYGFNEPFSGLEQSDTGAEGS